MSRNPDHGDHLVIGGGPAGAMLASELAKAGKSVTLLERSNGPHHKVCGEFLSWEARRLLTQAGVDIDALGGPPIHRLRIVSGTRTSETRLPGTAAGISRFCLDEALLRHAERCGAEVRRGVHVRALEGRNVRMADGTILTPKRTWLATGKTDLRGAARAVSDQKITHGLVGFKTHLQLADADWRALHNTIELHRFRHGYAGLQPIEAGQANLCLLVEADIAAAGWGDVQSYLARAAPMLARRLAQAKPLYDQPLAIARVPYGFIDNGRSGHLRIGDQLAVIHSFTGDGMAIAIASGLAAAGLAENTHDQTIAALDNLVRRPVTRAALFYNLLSRDGIPLDIILRVPMLASIAARLTRVV